MYIKKVTKRNPKSNTTYEYLHLVENIRTASGPRQRLILNLGSLDISQDQYKELANCIEGIQSGQLSLLSSNPKIEKLAKKAASRIFVKTAKPAIVSQTAEFSTVDVNSFATSEIRMIGPEYVCHSIWQELGLNELLLDLGLSRHILPIAEMLIVGRLVSPGSELHTFHWALHQSAIFELSGSPLKFSLNSLYRTGDFLFKHKDAIETHLSKRERDLFSLTEKIYFFDLTNTYFEGEMQGNPKAKRGNSKEKRTDCKLLTLALIIDGDGFAKYSQTFSGNQYEAKTLGIMIEALEKKRPDLSKDRTVVMDAGIATEENLLYLRGRNWKYVVVNRGNHPFKLEDLRGMTTIRKDKNGVPQVEVKRCQQTDEILLLCRSKGRVAKETGMRSRQESAFLDRLEYYRQGLSQKGHTKKYSKILEMIGRLREKYHGASRIYDVEVIPTENPKEKTVQATSIVWKKRLAREHDEEWDGCYVLKTNRLDLTDQEIWETYTMLTRIESAFKSFKASLGFRPNFHQKEHRADAHLFFSVFAYHLLQVIEWKLQKHGDHRSWETLREVLSTHQRMTLEFREKKPEGIEQAFLRMCSKPEGEHKMIYHHLKLRDFPLSKKILPGKKIGSDEKKQES